MRFFKSTKLSVILLSIVLVIIILHYVGILGPLEYLTVRGASVVQERIYGGGLSIRGWYGRFAEGKDIRQENEELKNENIRLASENAQLKTMIESTELLEVQERFLAGLNLKGISARIIGKSPEANLQSIILNRGSADGLVENLAVITPDGVIVGKITSVEGARSTVMLVNDSRSSLAAMIQNESQSIGVVEGEHGLSLKMNLILQNETVAERDVVVTSGLEPNIPRGLVIGEISRIVSEPNNFSKTAYVQPLVKISELFIVTVLLPINHE